MVVDHELRTQGFAVVPDVLVADEVAAVRAAIEAVIATLDSPRYYAAEDESLGDSAFVTSSGLALPKLLHDRPALAATLLATPLTRAVAGVLGDDMRLELLGALISDEQRPFFSWHTHIDGVHEHERVRANDWPAVDRLERLFTLLYLDDLDDDTGPLFVLPRRVGDTTAPAHDLYTPEWPGMVELRPRAGTAVVLDQCTWHAARSLARPGLRMFIAGYWAAASAKVQDWADADLAKVWRS